MKSAVQNFPARYWKKSDPDKITCFLCPRHCTLSKGQRGFCFIRQNIDGKLVLTSYGYVSGFCVDPIEKKPLYHFYPGSKSLSFGTIGCNLGCKFCQNWQLSKPHDTASLSKKADPEKIANAAKRLGCKSVSFTYNEPIISAEYTIDTAKECRKLGIKTVAVTAGYIGNEARAEFFEYIDAANVDLKAFTENFYREMTSAALAPVLETLIYLKQHTQVWLEVTTLLIPERNDSDEEINSLCQWYVENLGADVPLHFSAFHPSFQLLNIPATPPETLFRARKIALAKGIHYVYTGNVVDAKGAATYCVNCKELLIERIGYTIGQHHLAQKNHCEYCQAVCAGFFETHDL